MVGKGGSVAQGVGVVVVVTVGVGMTGVGVDEGADVTVRVSVGVPEGMVVDVMVGVIEGITVVITEPILVSIPLLLSVSGADTVQPTKFSITTNPISDHWLIKRCFISLYNIRFTSSIKEFIYSTKCPY
ncbi:MAG: hypothetical protein IPK53_08925 [bacterium]|nr:hypothetical protein [bacterium]